MVIDGRPSPTVREETRRILASRSSMTAPPAVAQEPEFDFSSPAYAELFGNSAATAFQHPLWLDRVYRHIVPSHGAEPLVVVVRAPEDGRLLAVLPLVKRRHRGRTVVEFADCGVSDYAAPVCDVNAWAPLRHDHRTRRLIGRALGSYDLLRISRLRDDSHDIAELLRPARRFASGTAHAASLHPPFSEWRSERMSDSRRREFDKKRRQLSRKGSLALACPTEENAVRNSFEAMRELRKPRFAERANADILTDPAAFSFYVDVAKSGVASGFARTYVLALDGRQIAGVFGICHRARFLTLLSAFDIVHKNHSLGYLLFEDVVQDCIARGETTFDLTVGDEAYKHDFGTTPTALSTLVGGGSVVGTMAASLVARRWGRRLLKRMARQ